jgi:hypothetical protein
MGSMRDQEYGATARPQQLGAPQAVKSLSFVTVEDQYARTVFRPLDKPCTELLSVARFQTLILERPITEFGRDFGG